MFYSYHSGEIVNDYFQKLVNIITVRNSSSERLCSHRRLSVHRGVYTPLPGRHPPVGRHTPPADGYRSGRYASYWNTFLLSGKYYVCRVGQLIVITARKRSLGQRHDHGGRIQGSICIQEELDRPPWVCLQGGWADPPPPPRYYGIWSTSGQYASYGNAFLLVIRLRNTE